MRKEEIRLSDDLKQALSHGVIAFLFGLGLALPLLGALDLLRYGWTAAGILLASCAALTACSLRRVTRLALAGAALLGAAVWLLGLGGVFVVTQVARAISLQLSGQTAALPLFATEAAILLTVLVALASWVMTVQGVGFYPALAVLLLVVLILWLGDKAALMVWTLPAVAGAIALLAMGNHDGLSLRRVLPLAIAAVTVSYLLVPAGGIVSQPLKNAADSIRQRIYDYLFFTEPRTVFSLSTEGYYPEGINQLGGTASPTSHPVMLVATARKTYLRGAVKDEYTGRMWRDTTGGRRYLWISPRWTGNRASIFNMDLPAGKLGQADGLMTVQEVRVQMLAPGVSTMFVPQRVRTLNPGGDLVPYFNNASEVFATRNLEAGDTYTVTAPLMVAGDAGLGTLIAACPSGDDPLYDDIVAMYTKLPAHLEQRVFDMARRAAEGAATPYEQAFAIQNYLSRNFRYTLDVADQPGDVDFVTNFLINTKEGYCTYFASAMTVLCRMVGLPARYVEGYLATPDASGTAYVTGLQAHAWTEVYFRGFGWLTFDATPAQNSAASPPDGSDGGGGNEPSPSPTATPTPTPPPDGQSETNPPTESPTPTSTQQEQNVDTPVPTNPDEAPNEEPPDNPPHGSPWLWWLLAVLAAAGVAARIVWTSPRRRAARAKTPADRFAVWVQAVHDALRVMKLPPTPAESPMAYMRRLDALRTLKAEMLPLGECMALVYYGRVTPEPEEIDMARDVWTRLFGALSLPRKARVVLERAFLPARKTDFTHGALSGKKKKTAPAVQPRRGVAPVRRGKRKP